MDIRYAYAFSSEVSLASQLLQARWEHCQTVVHHVLLVDGTAHVATRALHFLISVNAFSAALGATMNER